MDEDKAKANIDEIIDSLMAVPLSLSGEKVPLKKFEELSVIKYSKINAKTKAENICDYVAIDTETTGLGVRSNVIEISAVRFKNFTPVDCFTTLCDTDSVPDVITEITGITKEMLKGKPRFYQLIPDLQNFVAGYNLVGHNLPFDVDIMRVRGFNPECEKRKYFDTLGIAKSMYKVPSKPWLFDSLKHSVPNLKLDTLLEYHGITRSTSHRSLSDALATGILFKSLYDELLMRAQYNISGKI